MLAITACAAARESSQRGVGNDARIPVEITNDNWLAIAVYAVEAGVPFRIGTVDSFRTEVIRLPWSTRPADSRFVRTAIGHSAVRSGAAIQSTTAIKTVAPRSGKLYAQRLESTRDAAVRTSERNWDADRTR